MIKNLRITIVFFLLSGVVIAISNIIEKHEFSLIKLIGSATILFGIPLIMTYLIMGINRMLKLGFQPGAFISTYMTAWILFCIYNLIAVSTNLGWPPIP